MSVQPVATTDQAILEGWLYVPLQAIGGRAELDRLRATLTHTPRFDEEGKGPVLLYDVSRAGYLGVPRAFGMHFFGHLPIDDRTTLGEPITVPRLPDPHHPRVKDPVQQAAFMAALEDGLRRHKTFIGSASTGSGKTVCALRTAAVLGRTTIVILHLSRLLKQWREEAMDKLGLDASDIGIVQEDRCDYEGKKIVLAMGPSLMSRRYDPLFYGSFGLKIVDEVHRFGTRRFAPAYPLFPSHYALGLSATAERKDGGDKVFFWHLGGIRVTSKAAALECNVHVLKYDCGPGYELWGSSPQARAQCLSRDRRRNDMIAHMIWRFQTSGRNALIVSDSIAHLQELMALAEARGVPPESMGQFTAQIHKKVEELDPLTGRKVRKTKKIKRKDSELDSVKANSQIIFASYGMMTEGIDIPRLDAGLDATPRGAATQLIGRIRRPMPGKKKPVWVTPLDVRCPISTRLFEGRCKDYAASGAEVIFNDRAAQQRRGPAEPVSRGRPNPAAPTRPTPQGRYAGGR